MGWEGTGQTPGAAWGFLVELGVANKLWVGPLACRHVPSTMRQAWEAHALNLLRRADRAHL